jgi:trimeric autotransporter adhesin
MITITTSGAGGEQVQSYIPTGYSLLRQAPVTYSNNFFINADAVGAYSSSSSWETLYGFYNDQQVVVGYRAHWSWSWTTSYAYVGGPNVIATFSTVTFGDAGSFYVPPDGGPPTAPYEPGGPYGNLMGVLAGQSVNFVGGNADDTFVAGSYAGTVVAHGGNGNDTLSADGGSYSLFGDAGDDTIIGGAGDTLSGGTGVDNLQLDLTSLGTTAVTMRPTDTMVLAGNTSISGFESFTVYLGDGNDELDLRGAAIQRWSGVNPSYFNLAGGDNTVRVNATSSGALQLNLGSGVNTLVADMTGYANSLSIDRFGVYAYGVTPELSFTTAQSSFSRVIATGGSGNDTLYGDDLADTLNGGAGDDYLTAGSGIDTVVYSGARSNYAITLNGDGSYTIADLVGTDGTDLVTGVENFTFTDGTRTASELVNNSPFVAVPIPDQTSAEDTAFSFAVPAGSFSDVDNAVLIYTATLASGAALPSWLAFNAATQTFSGTPPQNYNGSVDVKVVASDGTLSIDDVFTFTVSPVNDAPVAVVDSGLVTTHNTPLSVAASTLLANDFDVDLDNLVITAVSGASHGTAVLQADGTIVFIPDADYMGAASFVYTISDPSGATSTASVNITVTGVAGLTVNGTSGNNVLTGTAGDDIINGLAGTDTLDGNGGVDTLVGGTGNDTYIVDSVGDVVTELAGQGTDLVKSSISWILGADVENLTLTGAANINGTGNGLNNTVTGNSGNNVLDGAGGTDKLIGGLGDDTYIVNQTTGLTITEAASAGTDTVVSSVAYILGANVENLTLAGNAAINATGNTLNNLINGNTADNILSGGTGADTLRGGAGNDSYIVDNVGDIVTELSGEGTDYVQSSISWTLSANVENLTLSGVASINGTGNDLNNMITGTAGNNILDGGLSDDTLIGGLGNDTYIVDSVGDVVTELAGQGTDLVKSSVSWILGPDVENLTLTGTANINGTGNGLNNTVTGNSGNNVLDGAGGTDKLIGGLGDDTYIVNQSTGLTITEAVSAGTDTVVSSVAHVLGTNLENLTLVGNAAINATGNTLNNTLIGNSAANTLNGGAGNDTLIGGLGNDTLSGGTGNDTFYFETGFGKDTITDFSAGAGAGDVMRLLLGTSFDTFAEVMAAATQVSTNTVITISALDTITLTGITKTLLVADDFAFV